MIKKILSYLLLVVLAISTVLMTIILVVADNEPGVVLFRYLWSAILLSAIACWGFGYGNC